MFLGYVKIALANRMTVTKNSHATCRRLQTAPKRNYLSFLRPKLLPRAPIGGRKATTSLTSSLGSGGRTQLVQVNDIIYVYTP